MIAHSACRISAGEAVATFWATNSLWLMIPLLTLIAAGTYASKGPFWVLSAEWLGPVAAAAGLAQINALERDHAERNVQSV